ncbi:lysozyme inhibitor LprI family protein [Clostridium sartagoforme]|uniref:lysozyme inhibitor LprI family protein n=1 Tax=Clostridium sartagoforme TaxID=84031 RepID=UPI0031DE19FE
MKIKKILILILISLSLITLSACNKDNKTNQNPSNKTEQRQQLDDSLNKVDNTKDPKVNENISETDTPSTISKIVGRRNEFIEKLDNIQKELDALPEKKDSDAGITNAMRSYYGISYDMYDKVLNEIYDLLRNDLSPETMSDLQTQQIKWIQEKEAAANKESEQYKGGTFEFVAYNSSLYESTKKRCYELVNNYMTD